MNKSLILSIFFAISYPSFAQPLSAVMTFESMTITTEGVKKQTYFQENFIRDHNTVWSERIIPTIAAHADHHEAHKSAPNQHDHEHSLNFSTAGKWLARDPDNNIKFRFVRKDDNEIIEPRVTEYGTLGFDGDWETAYYLVNRKNLKAMIRLNKAAPKDAQWYERHDQHNFTRILWDEKKEIPLSIETGKLDGSANNKITLSVSSLPSTLPWSNVKNYQTIAYEDLLD